MQNLRTKQNSIRFMSKHGAAETGLAQRYLIAAVMERVMEYGRGGERKRSLRTWQADGHVDAATKGGADGAGGQAQVLEDLGEGLGEGDARPLLRHHHAGAHAR